MNQIKILIVLIAVLTLQMLNCSGTDKLMFYRAEERADVDIVDERAGLIRTVYSDIYIEYVSSDNWKALKKTGLFSGRGHGYPVDPCFHFTIINTWNKPFEIDRIEVLSNGSTVKAEDYSFIKDPEYFENRYSINILSLMKRRRVLTDKNLLHEIDFENDTIEYRLNFIAPGDRVSLFSFIPYLPSEKSTRIRVVIKYHDMKKVIDFDIDRFEYKEIENMQY